MKVSLNCPVCGKEFQVTKWRIKHDKTHACSKVCQGKQKVGRPIIPAEQRFWKYVQKTDHCWLWAGGKDRKGYGQFSVYPHSAGHKYKAHQFSFQLHKGPIPDGMLVCHNCHPLKDNPSCLNPAHLWLGTDADNIQDASRKGTLIMGENVWTSKLADGDVVEIRKLFATGVFTQACLARRYGVTRSTVWNIVREKSWKQTT